MGSGVAMFLRHEGLSPDSCPRRVPVLPRHAHSSVGRAPDAAPVRTNKLAPATEDGHTRRDRPGWPGTSAILRATEAQIARGSRRSRSSGTRRPSSAVHSGEVCFGGDEAEGGPLRAGHDLLEDRFRPRTIPLEQAPTSQAISDRRRAHVFAVEG